MSHISKFCSPLAQQGPDSRLAASVESAQGVSAPTPDDLAGMAWYNAASEDTRRFWHGIAASAVPVDAWIAYRDTAGTICPSPAPESPIDSLAAPAEAVQEVCSPTLEQFQRWLETEAHTAYQRYSQGCRTSPHRIANLRAAMALLLDFKDQV